MGNGQSQGDPNANCSSTKSKRRSRRRGDGTSSREPGRSAEPGRSMEPISARSMEPLNAAFAPKPPGDGQEVEDGGVPAASPNKSPPPQQLKPANPTADKLLHDFISKIVKEGIEGLKNEWLTVVGTLPFHHASTLFEYNQQRNFPGGNPCLDHSRVHLTLGVPPATEYIHANWIYTDHCQMQRIILTQAPIDATVNDFWRMIYQEKCYCIIMLCEKYENGKRICAQYWPIRPGECVMYGQIRVQNTTDPKTAVEGQFSVHHLTVSFKSEPVITTTLFTFKTWKESQVPEDALGLLRMVKAVSGQAGPLVIHGAAGFGRPGTFAAIMMAMRTVMAGRAIDVKSIVLGIRELRMGAVANELQYVFIYRMLCEYVSRKGLCGPQIKQICASFDKYKKEYADAKTTLPSTPKTKSPTPN